MMSALVVVALMLAIATGCGSGDGRSPEGRSHAEAKTAPAGALSRRDAPPEGVRRQIEYFGIGDSICPNIDAHAPMIAFDRRPLYQVQRVRSAPDEVEIGEVVHVCPRGFPYTQPVHVTVRDPRGGTLEGTIAPGLVDEQRHVAVPFGARRPLGRYEVRASEDGTTARASFQVVRPRHRGVRLLNPGGLVRAGGTVSLVVVGLAPDTVVPVDVYRSARPAYEYVTSLDVPLGHDGVGALELTTAADEREGLYLFHPRVHGPPDQDLDVVLALCHDRC